MRISDWSSDVCSSDLHDIGCASEEEAAVANVPDSPRGTPAAESGGQYEKRTHRLTRGGGGFHSRSAGFGESIRKGSRGPPGGSTERGPARSFESRPASLPTGRPWRRRAARQRPRLGTLADRKSTRLNSSP